MIMKRKTLYLTFSYLNLINQGLVYMLKFCPNIIPTQQGIMNAVENYISIHFQVHNVSLALVCMYVRTHIYTYEINDNTILYS